MIRPIIKKDYTTDFTRLGFSAWVATAVLTLTLTPIQRCHAHDSTYVADHSKTFTARAYILKENFDFRILNGPGNNNNELGAWVYYKWFGIGLDVNTPFSGQNTESKGVSKVFDIKAHIYQKRWHGWLYVQKIGGYYVKNTQDIFKQWDPEKYYVRPDMATLSAGALGTNIFNYDKFSFRANYLQNLAQKKSAGSALLTLHYRHFGIKTDRSIVPGKIGEKFNPGDRINRGEGGIYHHWAVPRLHTLSSINNGL